MPAGLHHLAAAPTPSPRPAQVPFDFERRRLSVVLRRNDEGADAKPFLICKVRPLLGPKP